MDDLLSLRVEAVRALTPQIRELELRSADAAPLPRFRAGAHLRFQLPGERGTLDRCYSLINSAQQCGTYRIAVHRSPRSQGGSAYMCEQVGVGTVLKAQRPKNDFALAAGAGHHLLLAGGIGITPILSMAQALDSAGQSFAIHYAARTPESMAYAQQVRTDFGHHACLYFDNGDPGRGMPLDEILASPRAGTHVYVCGPEAMVDAVIAAAQAHGWARDLVHFELFSPPAPKAADAGIVVRLARSGRTLKVSPHQSILDAVLAAGCDPLFDCRRGECGACAVDVLEGVPDHRDYALSTEQRASNKTMCICVSRARSADLVLDL